MSENPRISIVTPSFNQGHFIEETIDSILSQGYEFKELIVIDGGSTDNSLEIIKKYVKHLAYFICEPDKGQSQAINKGLRRCTGDIVTWINSDDLLTKDAMIKVVRHFQSDASVDLLHGGTKVFSASKIIKTDFGYDKPDLNRYLAGMSFAQPSSFFKRTLLNEVGLLDENLHFGMDYDLFARFALSGAKFKKTDEIYSLYRMHDQSKSSSKSAAFMDDWIDSFVKVAVKLGHQDNVLVLEDLLQKNFTNLNLSLWGFKASLDEAQIDSSKMLFYILCYLYKDAYWCGNWERLERLHPYLKAHFSFSTLFEEKDMKRPFNRFDKYPKWYIKQLRKMSTLLK